MSIGIESHMTRQESNCQHNHSGKLLQGVKTANLEVFFGYFFIDSCGVSFSVEFVLSAVFSLLFLSTTNLLHG